MVKQSVGDLPVMHPPCRQTEPDREPLRVDNDMGYRMLVGRKDPCRVKLEGHDRPDTRKSTLEFRLLDESASQLGGGL